MGRINGTSLSNNFIDQLNQNAGTAVQDANQSIQTLISSGAVGFVIFGIQVSFFLLFRLSNNSKLKDIYEPRKSLVPERQKCQEDGDKPRYVSWVVTWYKMDDTSIIKSCGLDAFFFLRYLRLLLKIFIPMALIILPILIPINLLSSGTDDKNKDNDSNVDGLNKLGWSNVSTKYTHRLWAHLILACLVISWICFVLHQELAHFIKIKQAKLTSYEHRIKPTATTILVRGIPYEFLTEPALSRIFKSFPGGVRNIWINRDFSELQAKVDERKDVLSKLEHAETKLIKKCLRHSKRILPEVSRRESMMTDVDKLYKNAEFQAHIKINRSIKYKLMEKNVDFWKVIYYGFVRFHTGLTRIRLFHILFGTDNSNYLNNINRDFIFDDQNGFMEIMANVKRDEIINETEYLEIPFDSDHFIQHENQLLKQLPKYDGPILGWKDFLISSNRETMRMPAISHFRIPFFGKKVDKIYYLRNRLARLNLEIQQDREIAERTMRESSILKSEQKEDLKRTAREFLRYPLMNSAFVQFNTQIGAHMACQASTHSLPHGMQPRHLEVSPRDIIWENMSIRWWATYVRGTFVTIACLGIVIAFTIPVTFTSSLSQISGLAEKYAVLGWIKNLNTYEIAVIQGSIPPLALGALLAIVPDILRRLIEKNGVPTGRDRELAVQQYYFGFLFVQLFIVATLSTGITAAVTEAWKNIPAFISDISADLPKSSNYFLSFMIMQALGSSGANLLQINKLFSFCLVGPLIDKTARQKYERRTKLSEVEWGSYFPYFTVTAVIGMIFSIIAPIILIFNIISVSIFWASERYNILYVYGFTNDTGGVFFPRAVNQLFTGLYVMEVCLVSLFAMIKDEKGKSAALPQTVIMVLALGFTVLFQFFMNTTFDPLLHYLPVELDKVRELDEKSNLNGEELIPLNTTTVEEDFQSEPKTVIDDLPTSTETNSFTPPSVKISSTPPINPVISYTHPINPFISSALPIDNSIIQPPPANVFELSATPVSRSDSLPFNKIPYTFDRTRQSIDTPAESPNSNNIFQKNKSIAKSKLFQSSIVDDSSDILPEESDLSINKSEESETLPNEPEKLEVLQEKPKIKKAVSFVEDINKTTTTTTTSDDLKVVLLTVPTNDARKMYSLASINPFDSPVNQVKKIPENDARRLYSLASINPFDDDDEDGDDNKPKADHVKKDNNDDIKDDDDDDNKTDDVAIKDDDDAVKDDDDIKDDETIVDDESIKEDNVDKEDDRSNGSIVPDSSIVPNTGITSRISSSAIEPQTAFSRLQSTTSVKAIPHRISYQPKTLAETLPSELAQQMKYRQAQRRLIQQREAQEKLLAQKQNEQENNDEDDDGSDDEDEEDDNDEEEEDDNDNDDKTDDDDKDDDKDDKKDDETMNKEDKKDNNNFDSDEETLNEDNDDDNNQDKSSLPTSKPSTISALDDRRHSSGFHSSPNLEANLSPTSSTKPKPKMKSNKSNHNHRQHNHHNNNNNNSNKKKRKHKKSKLATSKPTTMTEKEDKGSSTIYQNAIDSLVQLDPEERDLIIRYAYFHEALRAAEPIVWIPEDPNHVAWGEMAEIDEYQISMCEMSTNGAAIDKQGRWIGSLHVPPPDFDEWQVIDL